MAAFAQDTLGTAWTVVPVTNVDAPPIITESVGLARATKSTIALFEGGYDPLDGVIVSAFIDPGLDWMKANLKVPAVGIAQAAMDEAAGHGRFVILSTTPGLAGAMTELVERYGHAEACAGIIGIEGDPYTVMGDPARLLVELSALLERAATELSAEAVIVGGGPLVDAARQLSTTASVPLVEPVPAAARALRRLIEERA
jgi:allantoin racemase